MNNSMTANERGVGGLSHCIGSQNVGFPKRNAAPLETNKVPKQRAQIITKKIKTKKLKTYN